MVQITVVPVLPICDLVQIYDFHWLNKVSLDSNGEIILIADDSHGVGVIGENGNGIFSQIPNLQNIKKLVLASILPRHCLV